MAFMSPAPMEIVVILVIALLVLGPARLPEAARSLGRGFRELRESLQGDPHDDEPESPPASESPYRQASPPAPGYAASGPFDDDLPPLEDAPTERLAESPSSSDRTA